MSSCLLNVLRCPPKLVKSSSNKSLTCKLRKKVMQLHYVAFNKLYFISHQGIERMYTLSYIIISTPSLIGLGGDGT